MTTTLLSMSPALFGNLLALALGLVMIAIHWWFKRKDDDDHHRPGAMKNTKHFNLC